jgi:hypothetical protein
MLNLNYPTVYNKTPTKEILWKVLGYVQFARLKNHMIVFAKARKERMVILNNVKFVDLKKIGNITKESLKFFLLNTKDGRSAIQIRFLRIKEHTTTGIKKKYWKSLKNQEKKMDMQIQKPIAKEIGKRLNAIILYVWQLNLAILFDLNFVKDVKTVVRHKLITMIIPNLWTLFGYVINVMEKNIEHVDQRERLSVRTPFGDAIVQTTEETCRGELEAVPPPRNWSVSKLLLKVIEWLRHTAGCSFYQGQCITNDLWIQNLRSTGI